MPRILSPQGARAVLAQQTGEVFLCCLQIYGPGLTTMYLVNNTVSIVRGVTVFQPYPFEAILPDDSENPAPTVTLRIDNVDRQVTEAIRGYTGIPKCRLDVVLASDPNHVEVGPFDFAITGVEYDAVSITATLGYEEDFLNQQVPAAKYLPSNSAGLFV
jgi:hypothetical protein